MDELVLPMPILVLLCDLVMDVVANVNHARISTGILLLAYLY